MDESLQIAASPSMPTNKAPSKNKPLDVHIRWMIRRDMPEVLEIERHSFEYAWLEDQFIRVLRQRNCIGQIAQIGEDDETRVVAFMIYELHRTRLHLLNFAVHEDYRGRSVARQMITKLVGKLSLQRRNRILGEIRETNLPALCAFRQLGFKAISVLRAFYEDPPDEDAILMQYVYKPERPNV